MLPEAVLDADTLAELADAIAERVAERVRPMEPLLSTQEVAKLLGLSARTVRDMISGPSPELPSIKVGSARRIDQAAVRAYLAARSAND